MVRLLGVVLVSALALPAEATPRAKGKVIRIERARASPGIPRICDMQADKTGLCLGSEPMSGEIVMVLDETGVIAQARIGTVMAFAPGAGAGCKVLWRITTEVVVGDLSAIQSRTIGVVDAEVHQRKGRMYPQTSLPQPPDASANDKVLAAIDREGDGSPDIVLTQTECLDPAGQRAPGMCVDEWARVGNRLAKLQHTNFATCGF